MKNKKVQQLILKVLSVLEEIKRVGMVKSIIYPVVLCLSVLYFVAFVMKDSANHKFVRDICKEFLSLFAIFLYPLYFFNGIIFCFSLSR